LSYFIAFAYIISFQLQCHLQGHFFSFPFIYFVIMYNLRTRARAALSGSARTQGMGVCGSSNLNSQVTQTQAIEILKTESETVPDTEIPVSDVNDVSTAQANDKNTLKSEATQPPIHTQNAHLDFTLYMYYTRMRRILMFQCRDLSVYLPVCIALTFESLDRESSFLYTRLSS